jgi:hypothetical protein
MSPPLKVSGECGACPFQVEETVAKIGPGVNRRFSFLCCPHEDRNTQAVPTPDLSCGSLTKTEAILESIDLMICWMFGIHQID